MLHNVFDQNFEVALEEEEMKKIMLVTLATLSVSAFHNQSKAAGAGRGARPETVRARETKEARQQAAKAGRAGADAATATAFRQLEQGNFLADLSPNQRTALSRNSADPTFQSAMKDIAEHMRTPEFRDLASARLRAMSNIPAGVKLDQPADALARLTNEAQAELTYDRLALRTYVKELKPETRAHVAFLLTRASEIVEASGGRKSRAEALREANDAMAKPEAEGGRSTRLDLENVNKYCK